MANTAFGVFNNGRGHGTCRTPPELLKSKNNLFGGQGNSKRRCWYPRMAHCDVKGMPTRLLLLSICIMFIQKSTTMHCIVYIVISYSGSSTFQV